MKVNPDTVAKTMRRARNEKNERVFQMSKFLTSQQVPLHFSKKKNRKPHKSTLLRRLFVPRAKYQLSLKTKEHLLQMKIKDL